MDALLLLLVLAALLFIAGLASAAHFLIWVAVILAIVYVILLITRSRP
jgi:hypothetical protein